MSIDVEYLVVGAGAMGSAAAWHLSKRGKAPLLLEQFDLNHTKGASHGQTRNFNPAYAEPEYIAMLHESFTLYKELEAETGTKLLNLVGLLNIASHEENSSLQQKSEEGGITSTLYSSDEAKERWPGWNFEESVLFYPQAGPVRADDSLRAMHASIRNRGGTILSNTRILKLEPGDDHVVVHGEHESWRVRNLIVTAGGWSSGLLGDKVPPMQVTQEQPAHFPLISPVEEHSWPSFNHRPESDAKYSYWRSGIYGLISPGEGLKVGWHAVGKVVDPDTRDYLPDPEQMRDLQRYVREWIPGVDWQHPDPISCTYTLTQDEHFVIDKTGRITIGAGFSGHGFKFVPSVGRMLADLAMDEKQAPAKFSLQADRTQGRRLRW